MLNIIFYCVDIGYVQWDDSFPGCHHTVSFTCLLIYSKNIYRMPFIMLYSKGREIVKPYFLVHYIFQHTFILIKSLHLNITTPL